MTTTTRQPQTIENNMRIYDSYTELEKKSWMILAVKYTVVLV